MDPNALGSLSQILQGYLPPGQLPGGDGAQNFISPQPADPFPDNPDTPYYPGPQPPPSPYPPGYDPFGPGRLPEVQPPPPERPWGGIPPDFWPWNNWNDWQ
jgi:hypothetical protein